MNTTKNLNLLNSGTVLPSPFHLGDNQSVIIENKNKNCTHSEIDMLCAKGLINTIDFAIMKLLAKYQYLNAYNITSALNHELPTGYQKEDYKRNLRKLVKAGILIRYAVAQPLSEEEKEQSLIITSPLRFYELSYGAYTYMVSSVSDSYTRKRNTTDTQIFHSLAVSQFLIHLDINYRSCVTRIKKDVSIKAGEETFSIPAEIHASASAVLPSLRIYLLCGRDDTESRERVLATLPLLSHYLNNTSDQDGKPLILLLLENMWDIPDMHHRILTMHNTLPNNLFYITDTSVLSAPIFQNLYLCDETNRQYRIKHYSLTPKSGAPN